MPGAKDDHRAEAYAETVRGFVQDGQGEFLACTGGKLFLGVLRKTLRLQARARDMLAKIGCNRPGRANGPALDMKKGAGRLSGPWLFSGGPPRT